MSSIECAVIIPITLSISILVVWLAIFFYDKDVISNSAITAVTYGSENSELENEEIVKLVKEKFDSICQDELVLMKDIESTITVNGTTISITADGTLNIPNGIILGQIYNKDLWHYTITQEAPRLKASQFVRCVSILKQRKSNEY